MKTKLLRPAVCVLSVLAVIVLAIPQGKAQTAAPGAEPPPSSNVTPLQSVQARTPAVPAADDAGRSVAQTAAPQRDLSPWSMFLSADLLVKAVIVCLILASLATWTIFFAKTVLMSRAMRRLRAALARIGDMRTMAEAHVAFGSGETVLSALLAAAMQEVRMSGDNASDEGVKERTGSRFAEIARMEARAMRQGMAILATVGATAPFIGLFGTVWGIMNSFIGISKAHTTNLAVVAPGIAEALLATAIGLIAAIPAVMIYNYFSRATKSYLELVGAGSGAVGRLLSRDLDRVRDHLMPRAAE